MNKKNVAKDIVQVTGWKKENQTIPEEDITEIVKSALNMQSGQYTGTQENPAGFYDSGIFHNAKPFKIWIPHRGDELENVLSLAGIHSVDQDSNQVFQNVKNVIVYLVHEPEHIFKKKDISKIEEHEDKDFLSYMALISDPQMNWKIKKDWDDSNILLNKLLATEKNKREKREYNDRPEPIVPFHNFSGEHLALIYSALGMAIGAANIQARELGYHTQFHTAYRASVAWRDFFGNRFHPEGKWYPHLLQIIGTHPQSAKANPYRTLVSDSVTDTSTLIDPNDLEAFSESTKKPVYPYDFDVMDVLQHRIQLKNGLTKNLVPEYQKVFWMKHYGRYSADHKKLFHLCYGNKAKVDY